MCKGQAKASVKDTTATMTKEAPNSSLSQGRLRLLASVESFCGDEKSFPNVRSMLLTGAFVIVFLIMVELTLRQALAYIKHLHPLLDDETNRNILARHVGVDSFSCFVVSILGWKARHIVREMTDAVLGGNKNAMPKAYENRMYKYHPEAARISLFFFAYQIKNTYDTIAWNDGPEFIMHHILTLFTIWGALYPGSAHFYVPFYFGVSEVSTAILCLLANFDDVHGVKGLASAFPIGKVALGGLFAVSFLICRVFMWSTVSYYYCRDAWNVLSGTHDPRLVGRKTFFSFTLFSLSLLSLLQIVWLGEIVRIGMEELTKAGLL